MKSREDILASIPDAPKYVRPQKYCIVCGEPVIWEKMVWRPFHNRRNGVVPGNNIIHTGNESKRRDSYYSFNWQAWNLDGSRHKGHSNIEIDKAYKDLQ